MNEGLIPRRYAKALFEVATEQKQDQRLYVLMTNLEEAFDKEPQLQKTLANPFVSDSDKRRLLATAAGATTADKLFDDFTGLLAHNRRMDFAMGICKAYTLLYRQANNIYRVHTTSASKMAADQEDRLKALILRHLGGGTMEYSSSVDPSLIGGFTVTVDNERLDASVRQQLQQMRQQLIK